MKNIVNDNPGPGDYTLEDLKKPIKKTRVFESKEPRFVKNKIVVQ